MKRPQPAPAAPARPGRAIRRREGVMAPQHRPSAAAPRPRRARFGRGLIALLGLVLFAAPARPQTADGSPHFTTQPQIRIPFTLPPGGQVKLVQLFVSANGGATWSFHAAA